MKLLSIYITLTGVTGFFTKIPSYRQTALLLVENPYHNIYIANNYTQLKPEMDGFDMRYDVNTSNNTELNKIANHMKILKLVKKLENPSISQYDKLDHLANDLSEIELVKKFPLVEKIYGVNLEAGGLFDDWEFDIV
jgi:hypothetical protein